MVVSLLIPVLGWAALDMPQAWASVNASQSTGPGTLIPAKKDDHQGVVDKMEDEHQQYCPPRYYVESETAQLGWTLGPERSHAADAEQIPEGTCVPHGFCSTGGPGSVPGCARTGLVSG